MSRKVIIASSKTNAAARTQFEGTTFGELKLDPVFAGIYGSGEGVEAIVKPGNVVLRDDSSVLPEGDFNVFLIPTKNKAGGMDVDDVTSNVEEAIEEFIADELEGLSAALVAFIKDYKKAKSDDGCDGNADCIELTSALAEAKSL